MAASNERIALICMSDTHALHETLTSSFDEEVTAKGCDPETTLILFSGDWSKWPDSTGIIKFSQWMANGTPFISRVPKEHKLAVEGNHDEHWQRHVSNKEQLGFTLLEDEGKNITFQTVPALTIRVFGCKFNSPNVNVISQNCDVLLSHSPARHHERLGNERIADVVETLPLAPHLTKRVHISGHAHERHFIDDTSDTKTTWIGAAMLRNGEHPHHPLRKPIVFFPNIRH